MNDFEGVGGERRSFWQALSACSGTVKDRKNQYRFVAWTLAWGIVFTAMSQLLKSDYAMSSELAWLAAAVPMVFGGMAVLAYLRFLRSADEFLQKLQFEGLAIGFGFSIIFALGYQLFELVGAPIIRTDDFLLVMMVSWMFGQTYTIWKYR